MNKPKLKFMTRWNDYLEQYRKSAGKLMENKFNSDYLHFLVPNRTRQCSNSMNGFAHRVIMGMMNIIPISAQGPKGGNALLLQDAERMHAAYLEKNKTGTSYTLVQVYNKPWHFQKYPDNQKENGMNPRIMLRTCTEASNLERVHQFPGRKIEARW